MATTAWCSAACEGGCVERAWVASIALDCSGRGCNLFFGTSVPAMARKAKLGVPRQGRPRRLAALKPSQSSSEQSFRSSSVAKRSELFVLVVVIIIVVVLVIIMLPIRVDGESTVFRGGGGGEAAASHQ